MASRYELGVEALSGLLHHTKARLAHAIAAKYAKSRSSFYQWVKQASQGQGHVYRWRKRDPEACEMPQQEKWGDRLITAPLDMLDRRSYDWTKFWQKGKGQVQQITHSICQLRAEAKGAAWGAPCCQRMQKAPTQFSDGNAKGLAFLRPRHLGWLPPEAVDDLAVQFGRRQTTASFPWQLLAMLIVLLPKPAGGDRPICVEPLRLRWFLKLFKATAGSGPMRPTASGTTRSRDRRPSRRLSSGASATRLQCGTASSSSKAPSTSSSSTTQPRQASHRSEHPRLPPNSPLGMHADQLGP